MLFSIQYYIFQSVLYFPFYLHSNVVPYDNKHLASTTHNISTMATGIELFHGDVNGAVVERN